MSAASDEDFLELRNEGMTEACELTILMPCLNEAGTLVSCISKARAFLVRSGCAGEVVLCQEGARAPCCTRDEGGPFGAVL